MSKVILVVIIVVLLVVAAVVLWMLYFTPSGNNNTGQTPNNSGGSPSSFTTQGVKVDILRQGQGSGALNGNVVTVNYLGTLPNGTKFDSSYDRNQAFSFTLGAGKVIKGWDVGLIGMKVGEKRKLTIPPEMGYGATGFPAVGIPQNAILMFEVELLKIGR